MAEAAIASTPTGNAAVRLAGNAATSTEAPPASSTSRYSATDSWPAGRAGPGGAAPPVLPQEVLMEAGRDVGPGQQLLALAVAVDEPVRRQAVALHGLFPQRQVEMLRPLLEGPTMAPDVLDDRADA